MRHIRAAINFRDVAVERGGQSTRSSLENGTTFSEAPLFLEIFQSDEPKRRVPFTSKPEFPEVFGKWKTPFISLYQNQLTHIRTRLYNATASPASRLRWAGSLAIKCFVPSNLAAYSQLCLNCLMQNYSR